MGGAMPQCAKKAWWFLETQEVSDTIADVLNLPDEKREELTASGIPRFHNQVCWARQYLVWEGFIEPPIKRGGYTRVHENHFRSIHSIAAGMPFKWHSNGR
jgi:restriction system protein